MRGDDLFDLSAQYDEMLARGLRLSGEDKAFFIRGRLRDLQEHLSCGRHVRRILDFGCGVGDTTQALAERFSSANVVGTDTSRAALADAVNRRSGSRVSFVHVDDLHDEGAFDLCYSNGVFHHIDPPKRPDAVALIHASLSPGGMFALYENNPWNIGTRWVMRRIPFDRDAQPLGAKSARRLMDAAGFNRLQPARFLFLFPRWLKILRFCEPWLMHFPFGAQYCVTGIK